VDTRNGRSREDTTIYGTATSGARKKGKKNSEVGCKKNVGDRGRTEVCKVRAPHSYQQLTGLGPYRMKGMRTRALTPSLPNAGSRGREEAQETEGTCRKTSCLKALRVWVESQFLACVNRGDHGNRTTREKARSVLYQACLKKQRTMV